MKKLLFSLLILISLSVRAQHFINAPEDSINTLLSKLENFTGAKLVNDTAQSYARAKFYEDVSKRVFVTIGFKKGTSIVEDIKIKAATEPLTKLFTAYLSNMPGTKLAQPQFIDNKLFKAYLRESEERAYSGSYIVIAEY